MAQRHAGNLPGETTRLVSRRQELAEAGGLFSAARLLTLTGVGGVGKTRLALRIAAQRIGDFPDGAWLAGLSSLAEGDMIAQAVAQALGLRGQTTPAALGDYLAPRRLLLVLDGCERLADDCADLVGRLLRASPGLCVLATSRQRLRVRDERVFEVPPLPVPDRCDGLTAKEALRYAAVALFAERAAATVTGYTVDDANAATVAHLCRRLDGIPLAIELAAVRLRALSAEQILDRLDDPFRLLTGGSPAAAPRQRTLRALVDWSRDLCTPSERALWERLAVFRGGFTAPAAEAVCAGDGIVTGRIAGALGGLADKSIVLRGEHGPCVRYRMMETIRQYGRSRLAESGCEAAVLRRHRDWCRRLAEEAEANWFGPCQLEWASRLRHERPNLCAALEFCLSGDDEACHALELAASLWSHRLSWSSVRDGHHWLTRALRRATAPDAARAKALWVGAWLTLLCGEPATAAPLLEESRLIAARIGDPAQIAGAGHASGYAALVAGDFGRATALLERALACRRAHGDRGQAFNVLVSLATAAVFGRDPRAADLCAECLDTCEREKAGWSRSYALWIAGLERWWRGDPAAEKLITDALRLVQPYHDHLNVAQCVEALAWIAADTGRHGRAAELLGAAHTVWRSAGTSLPGIGHLAAPHDRAAGRLHRTLGDRVFTARYLCGTRLTVDDAIALALEETPRGARPSSASADGRCALTPREREVAALVARGMSNRRIAETLAISQRTAEGHVERVLRKLGLGSRTEVTDVWAVTTRDAAPGDTAQGGAPPDPHRAAAPGCAR